MVSGTYDLFLHFRDLEYGIWNMEYELLIDLTVCNGKFSKKDVLLLI